MLYLKMNMDCQKVIIPLNIDVYINFQNHIILRDPDMPFCLFDFETESSMSPSDALSENKNDCQKVIIPLNIDVCINFQNHILLRDPDMPFCLFDFETESSMSPSDALSENKNDCQKVIIPLNIDVCINFQNHILLRDPDMPFCLFDLETESSMSPSDALSENEYGLSKSDHSFEH